MAYFTPYIDGQGIHVPTYTDIRDDLINSMKTIFGDDIYIDSDSQDYQQISIFAKKIFDANSLGVLIYNNRTANTAVGVGLDNLCALVGITRKPASNSTVQLTLTGSPSTVITNGVASDGTNNWILQSPITIPENGTIIVEAACQIAGYITALPNTITTIATPVYGWYSVTNTYSATPGVDQETDAELRGRYATATGLPASSIFDSIIASVYQVDGVTKVKAYENDTSETSTEGFPPHSITFVVEGGDDTQIATEIYYKKTPGCYTNGTTEIELTSVYGNITIIRFYRPAYQTIWVNITLKQLQGYNSNYATNIQNAIVDYINNLQIAETVYRSILWSIATSQMGSIQSPEFSVTDIQLSTNGTSFSDDDVTLAFNYAAQTSASNINIEVS